MVYCAHHIGLRKAKEVDRPFLLKLYTSTREDLNITGWTNDQRSAIVEMQFDFQTRHYKAYYPDAFIYIIQNDQNDVGRLYIEEETEELNIIDISILEEYRSRGIGTIILSGIINSASAKKKSVRLQVVKSNRALKLYTRLGFSIIEETEMHYYMSWKTLKSTMILELETTCNYDLIS